jgi:succinate dehydrogenase / fumarate reductase membrane anchor subunit
VAIGSKRLVVGAHYGLRDWLVQRLTAIILAVYTLFFVIYLVVLRSAGTIGYDEWASIFVPVWMKVLTLIAIFSLIYHAWIGMRDVWMDYIHATSLRLGLLLLTVLWLIFCAIWSVQILWSV